MPQRNESQTTVTSTRAAHNSVAIKNDRPAIPGNLFTGPDGIRNHRVKRIDDMYQGRGEVFIEKTSQIDYITSGPSNSKMPPRRHERIGEIGWPVQFFNMPKGL